MRACGISISERSFLWWQKACEGEGGVQCQCSKVVCSVVLIWGRGEYGAVHKVYSIQVEPLKH